MLAEHAETVHSEFVDEKQNFRDIFCNFLLQFSNNFDDIVIAKHGIHSDDDFPHDDKDVFLYLNVDRLEEFSILDPQRVQGVNNDVQKDVVHALRVLNAWIRKGEQYSSQ